MLNCAERSIYILFWNGEFKDHSGENAKVPGISIDGYHLIALFKPVLDSFEDPEFVESVVVIHEFGHAVLFGDECIEDAPPRSRLAK